MKLINILTGTAIALCSVTPLTAQTLTAWASPVKAIATDGSLVKSGGCDGCPDAGAHSATILAEDGYVEFVPAANARIIAGLSADQSASTSSATIDYAFSFWPGGSWEVRERGTYRADGTAVAGARFRVAVEHGLVVYRLNGTLVYRSTVARTAPLVLDATLFSLNAALSGATLVVAAPEIVPPPPPPTASATAPVVTTTGMYEGVTDRLPYAKPALAVLGPAGSTIVDPIFKSSITRVTDGWTRPDSLQRSYRSPSSPHQNAWSATGSRFYVVDGGGSALPYTFDAQTGAAQRVQPAATGAGGLVLTFYVEPQFSYLRDSVIYGSYSGPGGTLRTIDQYDFTTQSYSRLLDLDTLAPALAGTYIGGIRSSAGVTERIMAIFGGTRQDLHHYLVIFDAANAQNRLLLDTYASTINGQPTGVPLNFSLHSANMDRSGRYVTLYPTNADQSGTRQAPQSVLWDTQTNVFTNFTVSTLPYGHDAFGYGVSVNQDCCVATGWDAAQWQIRSLSAPLAPRDLLPHVLTPKEVSLADHSTWNNARPDRLVPFVSGLYRYGTDTVAWRAWDDEIVAIQTDAAPGVDPIVWRFAHHRSNVANDTNAAGTSFWYMPRPNVSPDGRWVLFTSNWEKTLGSDPRGEPGTGARQDVFLVALKAGTATPVAAVPVAITTTSLPDGRVSSFYSGKLLASGGSGAYSWTVTAGTLPAGVTLDAPTGLLSGMPLTAGSFSFSIAAADASDATNRATASYTIPVAPVSLAVAITTASLPGGRERTPYSATLAASGGSGAFRWSVTGGTLPPGVLLNAATGVVSGTPTNAGTTAFTITATDAGDALNVAARAYTVTMSAAVKIYSQRSLPMAAKGVPYTHTVASSNVQGMPVWDVASGTLPPGMLLNAAVGSISGTCLTAGKWTFDLRVKDVSTSDTVTLILMVK